MPIRKTGPGPDRNARGASGPQRRRNAARIPTGIAGFDALTRGGLPRSRLSVVSGASGCGKSAFALQILANAARRAERTVYVCFEEGPQEARANLRSFNWRLPPRLSDLVRFVDAGLGPNVANVGRFEISGLLANVESHCREIGATWVIFDGLDALLGILADPMLERREIYRLKAWIRDMRVGGLITCKEPIDPTPPDALQACGMLTFAADFVVHLSATLRDQAPTRSLRVVKHRGTLSLGGEFPFLLDARGMTVGYQEPKAAAKVARERVSSGIRRLDELLDGGYWRGSSILISGGPGTAKTTLAASFASAAARRRERVLMVSFDEDAVRSRHNLSCVGIDLATPVRQGMLLMLSLSATLASPEVNYVQILDALSTSGARHLVIDPVSALSRSVGPAAGSASVLQRLLEQIRSHGVTTLLTALMGQKRPPGGLGGGLDVATLADTWLMLAYKGTGGARERTLRILKSRGTNHSNETRGLLLGPRGVTLADTHPRAGEASRELARPGQERKALAAAGRRHNEGGWDEHRLLGRARRADLDGAQRSGVARDGAS